MPRLAPLLFIISILFCFHFTSGEADSVIPDGVRLPEPFHKVDVSTQEMRPKNMKPEHQVFLSVVPALHRFGSLYSLLPNLKVIRSRKLADMTLDYDYGGPNKKHDPPKGKPGIGSKGP